MRMMSEISLEIFLYGSLHPEKQLSSLNLSPKSSAHYDRLDFFPQVQLICYAG